LNILLKEIDKSKFENKTHCNNCSVPLQWIPAQWGLHGNEQANTLVNQGATEQPAANVSYQEKATITKALYDVKSREGWCLCWDWEQNTVVGMHICIKS